MLIISQKANAAIAAKNAVRVKRRAVATLKPSSLTRFLPNTVDEPNANAASSAYSAALFVMLTFQISFHRDP